MRVYHDAGAKGKKVPIPLKHARKKEVTGKGGGKGRGTGSQNWRIASQNARESNQYAVKRGNLW